MIERLKILISVFLLLGTSLNAQTRTALPEVLTLDEVIRIAMKNHPSLRASDAAVRYSEALVTQSRAGYFPTINYTGSGSHIEGAFVFNPSFPARQQLYNSYSTGVQVLLTVYDFGKTGKRLSANKWLLEATEFNLKSSRESVTLDAQIAYFQCLEAQHLIEVSEETVAQYEKHLVQAKALYSVGRRPQFDVTKANVDLTNARVGLIRARNQLRLAKSRLENAMGIHPENAYSASDEFSVPDISVSLDSAQAIARINRSEIRSSRARLEFTNTLARAEWSQHLPTLTATYNHLWSGFNRNLAGRYTAGLTFSLPIFQGFSISARVRQAEANAEEARAQTDLLEQVVLTEVEQRYLEREEAIERMAATSELVRQAEDNLKIVEGRYAAGVSSPIEITDAQVSLSNARILNIQALYDRHRANVRLRRAMGISGESN